MTPDDRSLATRLRERLRYGLATQEVLDRLARAGFVFYPYFLVREAVGEAPEADPELDSVTFAPLGRDDAALVAELPCRRTTVDQVLERMDQAECFGVFYNGELAGFSWARYAAVTTPFGNGVLFELDRKGAYLFDMYIARAYRGRRLAPWLRQRVHDHLLEQGRDHLYSVTLAHNRSSRKFKARFGAVEVEKRLLWGLKWRTVVDVRLRRLAPLPAPSPRWLSIPHGRRND